ncbi:hypothetical protein BC332_17016 [Capsicum chinense]|nr:hypothetical protein BC332_17016 [Capsicum chinense]
MEFPSIVIFLVSYYISSICCAVGLIVLITSNSDSDHPLSNVVIYVFAYWMSLSIIISSAYAFLLRPSLEHGPPYMPHVPADVMMYGLSQSFTRLEQRCPRILYILILRIILLFNKIITINGLLYSVKGVSLVTAYLRIKERFNKWGTWPPFMWIFEIWKIMKFALGMVGTTVFQYYFKFASVYQLVAFLCLAVTWLGNLAMIQPSTDLGIFNFLVVNACLGCAVNVFNLDRHTWLVFAACIFLCFLREKLDSVTLRYEGIFRFSTSGRRKKARYTYLYGCLGISMNLFALGILTWIVFAVCIMLCFLRERLDSVTLRHEQRPILPLALPSLPSSTDVVVVAPVLHQTQRSFTPHDCPPPPLTT